MPDLSQTASTKLIDLSERYNIPYQHLRDLYSETYSNIIAQIKDRPMEEQERIVFLMMSNTITKYRSVVLDYDITSDRIIISCPFEMKDTCKGLENRKWNPEKRRWEAPVTALDNILQKFPGATISINLKKEMEKLNTLKSMSGSVISKTEVKFKNGLALLPFQAACVDFLNAVDGKALIADEMGLGKTIEALAYINQHKELRPAIIICPASLKINWEREAKKWLDDGERITVVDSKNGIINPSTIYIINYDIVKKYLGSLMLLEAKLLILDESHYIKTHDSQRTKLVTDLSRKIPHRILLTGTPVLNRPKELFPQLNVIDPNKFNNFFPYAIKFCGAYKGDYGWDFSGATNLHELNELLKIILIRRKKADVLQELPEKRRVTIQLEIDNEAEYNQAVRDVIGYLRMKKGDAAADAASRAEAIRRIESLKELAVKGKMESLYKWIDDFLESDEKLVLFASHYIPINLIYKRYRNIAVRLTGEDSQDVRQDAVDRFQNNPDVKLFIGNMKAAGVGITLIAASNVTFIELDWTPAIHQQAEDRCHRIGQKNAITAYYLLAKNTIDEEIIRLLEKKSYNIDALLDGKEEPEFSIVTELIDELTGGE